MGGDLPGPPPCDRFSDQDIEKWLAVDALTNDAHLTISGDDIYNAHTAIRHLHEVNRQGHALLVTLPLALRKNRGFTPWLIDGRTVRAQPHQASAGAVCTLRFVGVTHAQAPPDLAHFASFDLRVAGLMLRVLVDSGATCSCVSRAFASKCGLSWTSDAATEGIGGVGGAVKVLGTVVCPVKVGKFQADHQFFVVEQPIAGYDALVGQDFLRSHECALSYTSTHIYLKLHSSKPPAEQVSLCRRIADGAECESDVAQPGRLRVCSVSSSFEAKSPRSLRERRRLTADIQSGRSMGYVLQLEHAPPAAVATGVDSFRLPGAINDVLHKHGRAGGPLQGGVPDNTQVKGYECHINLKPGANPVQIKQYRMTPRESDELVNRTQDFIKKGWIEPSTSPWCSSVLFVPKPNNKLRFCVDFRQLNERTEPDSGNIPHTGELLDKLQGAALFSALDLASGYYQLGLDAASRPLTAFPTPFGLYHWRVMPMGLRNAPAVFQRAMNTILREHILAGYCLVYLDDVIILSKSVEEHARHLDKVLTSLAMHNLFCNCAKCVWAKAELKYLGHLISGSGVKPDPAKVAAVANWEPPHLQIAELADVDASPAVRAAARKQIVHECRRYLGFMNYFNRFIPRYSALAAGLHDQTKDDAPAWSDDCTRAWRALRTCLSEATLMHHPRFNQPFHVYADASVRAIGGVLMQTDGTTMLPVAYCARKLTPAEVNYTTTEQEMLAVVYCFQQWRCYLEGPAVILHTDHEPLTWITTQKLLNRRQARWLEFLSRFQYDILYVKGDKNVVADALSRMIAPPDVAPESLPCEDWPDAVAAYRTVSTSRVPPCTPIPTRRAPAAVGTHELGACRVNAVGVLGLVATVRWCAAGGHTRRRATCAGEAGDRGSQPEGRSAQGSSDSGEFSLPRRRKRVAWADMPRHMAARPNNSGELLGTPPADNLVPGDHSHVSGQPVNPLEEGADHSLSTYERLCIELFDRVRAGLATDPDTRTEQQRTKMRVIRTASNLLWKDNRLYVPNAENGLLRQDILWWHHDVPWAAHLGIEKTVALVTRQFFWPKMEEDIRKYVSSCYPCQANKTDRKRQRIPLTPLTPPDSCWGTVGVDLIVDLPPSADEEFNAICVFVCHLSKMVRLVPTTTSLTTEGFARLFFREVFPHYGMPLRIVSDRGSQWCSEFFQELCNCAGVRLHMSTAYHPQSNGLVERYNEVIAAALRHYVGSSHDNWPNSLPFVEFALNDSPNKATGTTPFRMNRVSLPRNPFDAVTYNKGGSLDVSSAMASWMGSAKLSAGARTVLQAHEELGWARRCVHAAKEKMKNAHDARGVSLHLYTPGDWVWFNTRNVGLRHPTKRHKLQPKYLGPVRVLEVIGRSAVKLELPEALKIHPTVSISLVKPFRPRVGVTIPPVEIEGEVEWEVQAVIGHNLLRSRRKGGLNLVEFRVQWKGDYESSWHEVDDFENSMDTLEKYLATCTPAVRKQIFQVFSPAQIARFSARWQDNAKRLLAEGNSASR